MSELLTRDDFVSLISMMIKPRMPVDYPYVDIADIADMLRCSPSYAQTTYLPLPDFPKAIRLPGRNGTKGHPKFKRKEVIAWADKYQENRAN